MARILSADTEAFAPSTFKPTALPERESSYDRQLRRLSAEIGLAEKAIPLADLVARGGSTLYGGIKDWFAEREQEQKAEEAKARGVKGLDDFAGTKAPSGTTATEAVASGAPAIAPNEQQIAQDRLSKLTEQYANMSPEEQQRLSEESNRVLKQKYAEEQAKAQKLQAQKFYGEHPEFTRDVKSETLPQAAQALGLRDVELAQQKAISEQKWDLPRSTSRVADERAAKEAQRERDYIAKLGKQLPPEGTVVSPEREQEIMGEVTGDWFKPAPSARPVQAQAEITPSRAESRVFRDPRTGELRSVEPSYPAIGRGSLGYEPEVSREQPFKVGGKAAAPVAASAEAESKTAAPARIPIRHAAVEGFPATTPSDFKTTATADMVSAAAAKPVEAAKPAAPKTIGEATDDQLSTLKERLEAAIKARPEDQVLAGRLKDVDDELKYRQTKGTPRTYEQWAALARTADTPEKQARALELARDIHMPAGSLADLLTPSAQLAERQAMGTSTERGLFPALEKPSDMALRLKYIAQAEATGEMSHAKAQTERAKAYRDYQQGALYGAQTETEVGMLPYKKGMAEEKTFKLHSEHEKLDAQTNAINKKLGPEMDLLKARANRLRTSAPGRGAGRANLLPWAKELDDVGAEMVKEAQNVAKEAIDSAERAALNAQNAEEHARMVAEVVGDEPTLRIGATTAERIAHEQRVAEFRHRQGLATAARNTANLAKATSDKANAAAQTAQAKMEESVRAGNANRAEARRLYQQATGRSFPVEGEAPPVEVAPPASVRKKAAPTIKQEGAAAPAKSAFKIGEQRKDKQGKTIEWNGSKWIYP